MTINRAYVTYNLEYIFKNILWNLLDKFPGGHQVDGLPPALSIFDMTCRAGKAQKVIRMQGEKTSQFGAAKFGTSQTQIDHLENVSTGRTSSAYFSRKDQCVADSNLSSVLSGYACASSFAETQVLFLSTFLRICCKYSVFCVSV